MTAHHDLDGQLTDFLRDGPTELPYQSFDAVRDRTETARQRVVIGPWRLPEMNKIVTISLGAAAVVLAVLVGTQLIGSPTGGTGGPGDEPTASPEPTATPVPTATPEPAGLPEGPHLLGQTDDGAVAITVTIAASDWDGTPGEGFIQWGPTGAEGPTGAGMLGYTEGEFYVYGDPCAWSSTTPDTPATTVDELMAALANQASREASAPEDIAVAGYTGKKLVLHMADEVADFDACDGDTFGLFGVASEEGPTRYSQGVGQIEEVWAVDMDGVLVIIIGVYYPGTPQHAIDETRAILASATFELP